MALILILEDEPFIALDIEAILDEAGYRQNVTLTTCAEAVDWLNENNPRMAIVDPRLSDGVAATVVRLLVERKTPFVVYPENRTVWRKSSRPSRWGNFS